MAIAMKGIFKGLKIIAQIFTMHKEHEMEIGYPTDVRHVSHIGLGASDSCPSWMNEFRGLAEASAGGPVSSVAQSRQTSWASLDFEQPIGVLLPTEACTDSSGHDAACGGTPRGPKKATRTKKARASSPSSSAKSPSWRSMASFATACDDSGELPSALRVA